MLANFHQTTNLDTVKHHIKIMVVYGVLFNKMNFIFLMFMEL